MRRTRHADSRIVQHPFIDMPASRSPWQFELLVAVAPGDIDELGHVNNAVYLRWIQEVATAHWRAVASSAAQATIAWVVLRHEIDYKTPALPGDEVLLRTRVGHATRLTFERFTDIVRASDQIQLSSARTVWCPINPKTGRPARVDAEVRAQFSTDGGAEQTEDG